MTIAFIPLNNPLVISAGSNDSIVRDLIKKGYKIHKTIGLKGEYLKLVSERILLYGIPKELLRDLITKKSNLVDFLERML